MISLRLCVLLLLGAPIHGLAASVSLPPAGAPVLDDEDGTTTDLLSSRASQTSTDLPQILDRRDRLDFVKFLGSYAKTNAGKENLIGVGTTWVAVRTLFVSWAAAAQQCISTAEDKGNEKKGNLALCALDAVSLAAAISLLGWQGYQSFKTVNNIIAAFRQQTANRPPKKRGLAAAAEFDIDEMTLHVRDVVVPTMSKALVGSGVEIRHLGFWNDTTTTAAVVMGKRDDDNPFQIVRPVFGARSSSSGTDFHFAFLDSVPASVGAGLTTRSEAEDDDMTNTMTMRLGFGSGLEARDVGEPLFLNGVGIDIKMKMLQEPDGEYKKAVSVDQARETISKQLNCMYSDRFAWQREETNALHLEIWDLMGRFPNMVAQLSPFGPNHASVVDKMGPFREHILPDGECLRRKDEL